MARRSRASAGDEGDSWLGLGEDDIATDLGLIDRGERPLELRGAILKAEAVARTREAVPHRRVRQLPELRQVAWTNGRSEEYTAWAQNAAKLPNRKLDVGYVVEHVHRQDRVAARRRQRHGVGAGGGDGAAGAACLSCHSDGQIYADQAERPLRLSQPTQKVTGPAADVDDAISVFQPQVAERPPNEIAPRTQAVVDASPVLELSTVGVGPGQLSAVGAWRNRRHVTPQESSPRRAASFASQLRHLAIRPSIPEPGIRIDRSAKLNLDGSVDRADSESSSARRSLTHGTSSTWRAEWPRVAPRARTGKVCAA